MLHVQNDFYDVKQTRPSELVEARISPKWINQS